MDFKRPFARFYAELGINGRLALDIFNIFGIIMLVHKTRRAGVAHLAERHLAKVEVASSNLVARSKKKDRFILSFFSQSVKEDPHHKKQSRIMIIRNYRFSFCVNSSIK